MEHELKFQEFIGFGREEDISHLKMAYETVGKKWREEINLRNYLKDDLV